MTGLHVTPLWQAGTAPPALEPQGLPAETDVLVVGGGYTGLSAARETAAAGLQHLGARGGIHRRGLLRAQRRAGGVQPQAVLRQAAIACTARSAPLPFVARDSRRLAICGVCFTRARLRLARMRVLFRRAYAAALRAHGARGAASTARSGAAHHGRAAERAALARSTPISIMAAASTTTMPRSIP